MTVSATATIDESLFPRQGTDAEKLAFLLQYAIQAPSVRNTQPWSFTQDHDGLIMQADLSRKLRHIDPHGRELTISCGAALEHLAIAIRYYGREATIQMLPDKRNPRLLARIALGPTIAPDADDLISFYAIFKRTTERGGFKKRPIPRDLHKRLLSEGYLGDAQIVLVEDRAKRSAIADVVADASRTLGADSAYRTELAAWWTAYGSLRPDGVPAQARGVSFLGSALEQWLIEGVDLGKGRATANHRRIVEAPLIAVVSTVTDEPLSWLLCGRSLARLLLRARAAGLSASFFSEPAQVPEARTKLVALLAMQSHPQVVLRFGYTNANVRTRTLRRPVHDILAE